MLEHAEHIKQYPFVRILLPYMLGILLAVGYSLPLIPIAVLSLFLLVSIIFLNVRAKRYLKISGFVVGGLLNVMLVMVGFINGSVHNGQTPQLFSDTEWNMYHAQVIDAPELKPRSIELAVRILAQDSAGTLKAADELVVLYLQSNKKAEQLKLNAGIVFKSKLQLIAPPLNPDQFSFKAYMARQGVYRTAYVDSMSWVESDVQTQMNFRTFLKQFRFRLLSIYKQAGLSGRELALMSALTLGYKDLIDDEMRSSFTSSGTIHVLAVSGLHVGIVYYVIAYLLNFLLKWKRGALIRFLLTLSFIWFYALLTGFSPSVIRAALMFSFLLAGKTLNRDSSSINIIAASAFFILAFDPFTLKDVGFQFSYLAVIGIVYFHPKIYGLLTIKRKLIDKMWSLCVVSISAQFIIAPLSIHYFNQFPTLFVFANLIIIPAITFLLYLGGLILLLSFIPVVMSVLVWLVKWTAWIIFLCIDFIDGLSFSIINDLYLSIFSVMLMYVLILMIIGLINTRNKRYVYASLISLLLVASHGFYRKVSELNQQGFHLLCADKTSVLFIQDELEAYLVLPAQDFDLAAFYQFNKHFFLKRGCGFKRLNEIAILPEEACYHGFLDWKDKLLLLPNELDLKRKQTPSKLFIDYLVLSNEQRLSLKSIQNFFDVNCCVFDPSCKSWQLDKWKKECRQFDIPFYDMRETGALQL